MWAKPYTHWLINPTLKWWLSWQLHLTTYLADVLTAVVKKEKLIISCPQKSLQHCHNLVSINRHEERVWDVVYHILSYPGGYWKPENTMSQTLSDQLHAFSDCHGILIKLWQSNIQFISQWVYCVAIGPPYSYSQYSLCFWYIVYGLSIWTSMLWFSSP